MTVRWLPFAMLALALWPASALAQPEYPVRPITLIVPTPPGGTLDRVTRLASEKLRGILGVPVVLEYKPGAGLNLGAAIVAHAAPVAGSILALSVPPCRAAIKDKPFVASG